MRGNYLWCGSTAYASNIISTHGWCACVLQGPHLNTNTRVRVRSTMRLRNYFKWNRRSDTHFFRFWNLKQCTRRRALARRRRDVPDRINQFIFSNARSWISECMVWNAFIYIRIPRPLDAVAKVPTTGERKKLSHYLARTSVYIVHTSVHRQKQRLGKRKNHQTCIHNAAFKGLCVFMLAHDAVAHSLSFCVQATAATV